MPVTGDSRVSRALWSRHKWLPTQWRKQQVPDLTRVHVHSDIHCQAGVSSYVGDSQMITDCV
jgi:hypothetical protein